MIFVIYVLYVAPVCFNAMDCEGDPVSDDSISFAQCCFGLSAVSFALPGQCSLCPTPSASKFSIIAYLISNVI